MPAKRAALLRRNAAWIAEGLEALGGETVRQAENPTPRLYALYLTDSGQRERGSKPSAGQFEIKERGRGLP